MTLRERLVALARSQKLALTLNLDEMVDVSWHTREEFAFAAARMALEDAENACREKAQHDYLEAEAHKPGIELLRRVTMGNRCDDCAEDIRALRDELDGPSNAAS